MSTLAPDPGSGYADLTPDEVLDALDAVGFIGDGRILQLNSYENRVFQVMLEDGSSVVTKFYRPGRWTNEQIVEEHQFSLELEAAEVPVVAPLILSQRSEAVDLLPNDGPATLALLHAASGTHRFSVSPRRAGRAPELEDDSVLRRLGGFIGRLHAVGSRRPFQCRRTLNAPQDAREALQLLRDGDFVPEDQRSIWSEVCARTLDFIDISWTAQVPRLLRLHGDCHPGNLLWRDEGAHVVDLDDCCMGPAVQDLWMLLSGDSDAMARQFDHLVQGYGVFCEFDYAELDLIESLRLLRMIRHNSWLARRWADPAFPRAFPDFGSSAYWAQQVVHLREQLQFATTP